MDRTAPARAATRALAVLAVLLGLLAMHGLASNHHAAAATTESAPHGAAQHQAATSAPEHHQHGAAVQDAAAVVAAPEGPACGDHCPGLAVLCVAVLTGVALLALLLARRRAARFAAVPRHDQATRAPPVRPARPPDPVKELCVSRT